MLAKRACLVKDHPETAEAECSPRRASGAIFRRLSCSVAGTYYVTCGDIGVRYQLDHLTPLAIGGAPTAANLWPQPMAQAGIKERCDRGVQALVCHGGFELQEARTGHETDWPAFCCSRRCCRRSSAMRTQADGLTSTKPTAASGANGGAITEAGDRAMSRTRDPMTQTARPLARLLKVGKPHLKRSRPRERLPFAGDSAVTRRF